MTMMLMMMMTVVVVVAVVTFDLRTLPRRCYYFGHPKGV